MIALVIALVLGLALSLANPTLLLWIAVGVTLAFLPEILRGLRGLGRKLNLSRRELARALPVLVGVGAVLVVAVFLFFNATDPLPITSNRATVAVDTLYEGQARLIDGPPSIELVDTLTITPASIEAAAKAAAAEPELYQRRVPPPGGDFARALKADIEAALTAQGWTAGAPSTAGREFRRTRPSDVEFPRVWAQRTISLSLPRPRLETEPASDYSIELKLTDKSRLVVTAEKSAIGASFPEGETQSYQRDDDLEQTVISPLDSGDEVELKIRRPLFREEPFVRAADLTLNTVFAAVMGLLFLTLAAIAKDEAKAVLKRLLDRILGRKPQPEE